LLLLLLLLRCLTVLQCAIITPDSKIAVGILSIILVVLFSFSGYLVRLWLLLADMWRVTQQC
jgi:hypothetical protein